jgi:hypothetical protein
VLVSLVAVVGLVAPAQADPVVSWATRAGGTGFDEGRAVAMDADGAATVTGRFGGSATFGVGEEAVTLTASGGADVFVARYAVDGSLAWAVQAGGVSDDGGFGVAVDDDGAATVTGSFAGSATFGAGEEAVTLTSSGATDVFVARYAVDGSLAWAVRAGGTSADEGYGVAVDDDGAATVTGSFAGSATFGVGEDAVTLVSSGSLDLFVARYAVDGSLQWAVQAGGTDFDEGLGLGLDAHGAATVTGRFVGSATFGLGEESVTLVSSGGRDVFVARYSVDGSLQWAVQAGGTSSDEGYGVAVDADGAATVTGRFGGSATFGVGEEAVTLVSSGSLDVFVARYTVDGSLQWAVRAGGTGFDAGFAVAVDAGGAATVTGSFGGSATFGAGDQAVTLVSSGGDDVFATRYAADGSLQWAGKAGGTSSDLGLGVAVDAAGATTVTGRFSGSATFGAGEEAVTLVSSGGFDVFVTRFVEPVVVDETAPTVIITTPADEASYLLNEAGNADYSCVDEDGGSGIDTCVGTVAVGDPLDTSTVGSKDFTVTGTDLAGNETIVSVTYRVEYGFSGFSAPVNPGALNVVKAGSAVPLKFTVTDATGAPVSTLASVSLISAEIACPSTSTTSSTPTPTRRSTGKPGLQNLGNGTYQFNVATPKTWAGTCRTLGIDLGDGIEHTATFRFR